MRERLRLLRVTGVEFGLRLLIGAAPQIVPHARLCARRLREQDQGREHQPAAAKTECDQRHEREQQPWPAIEKTRTLHFSLGDGGCVACSQWREHRVQVAAIACERRVAASAFGRDRRERRAI